MTNDDINIRVDSSAAVLYAKRLGARIVASHEAPSDSGLILNTDERGAVVGLQLLDALTVDSEWWRTHPDRRAVPEDLFCTVDRWLLSHVPA